MIKPIKDNLKHLALAAALGASFLGGSAQAALTWNPTGGGPWDTTTANWTGDATTFISDGSQDVIFDKAVGGAITVSDGMNPASTTVSAASGTYTFNTGPITGSGGLTKSGAGQLTMNTANNTFTGKTSIQGGTLLTAGAAYLSNAGAPGVFGAPPAGPDATIDLHNGVTLQNNGSNPRVNQSTDRPLNLAGTDSGTVSVKYNDNDASLTFGGVTATGTGPKTLALFTGINGNGDREAMIFTGAIDDSSDDSPTSLAITFNTQGSPNWVSLNGVNTFTGPITLAQINGTANGVLVVGGVRVAQSGNNTVGTGSLGNGNYLGAISLGARTVFEYDSTAEQALSGVISGTGAMQVTGSGQLTLSGANTYSGSTTVNSGCSLVLETAGGLNFVLTNGSSNKITGGGTANLDGTFTIDTSAVTAPIASWTLVDVTTKSFGSNFNVPDFTETDNIWTKVAGSATWTFTEASGVLSVNTLATITSFGIPGHAGVIDNSALTITLYVPYGTPLATLAPTFTVTSGSCNQTSGSRPTPTFAVANPASYTVTDGAAVSPYTATVVVAPAPPAGLGVSDGLVAWYDASQLTDLGDGNSVDTWADLSGYGHIATRTAGTMSYAANQVNGLPSVQFRSAGYADIVGTMFAKEQYMVFKSPKGNSYNGDWGAVLGDVTDQYGYMMGDGTRFWGGNYPAAVSQNGTVLPSPWNITNMGSFLILKIVGTYPNTTPRSYSLGNVYGNGSPQYHNVNLDVAEIIAYDHPLTLGEEAKVGRYLADKYALTTTYPGATSIVSLGIPGYPAAIDQDAKTIALTVPNETNLATLAPTFELNSGTCVPASGVAPSPSFAITNPATYTVTDGPTVNPYSVTVTVLDPFPAPTPPPVTSDMAVWLTADNVNPADPSQARVSGTDTFVKQWNDLSGRINNAANTAESQQPKYIADSLNGNPVLRFAQVDDNTGSRLFLGDLSAQFGVPLPDPYPTTTNIGTGGTSLDGAYVNTPTRGVAGALVGSSDPAATFNGSNQRMLVPFSAELNPAAPWTTEIWVQPAALLVSGDLRCAVSNGQFGSPRSGWLIYQDVDKWNLRTYSGVGTGIAAQLTSAAGTASASTWHHLVVVNDATTLHLYVDGAEVGTGVAVGETKPGASGGTCVGARSDGAFYWPGVADELVIYPTALSAADVTAHYANASNPSPSTPYATLVGSSNPVGYYRLNELAAPVGTRQAATLFAVTTLNSDNMYSVFGNRANDERWMGGNWSQVTPGAFRGGRADFSSQYALMPQTGSHIFAYECSPAAYNFLLNGTLIGTTSGDYNSGNGANWVVGNNASNNGAQLNGDIAELIIYNRILTTEEANRVGAYLEGKYGLDTAYEFTATGYDAWKTANAGNQDADQDYDNDGMPNGVEYFMGGTGSSFTPNPRVAGGKVSWPHDAGATGVTYKVWTSGNLTTWTDVTGATVDEAGFVTYTLPTVAPPTKLFIRLEVQVP